MTQKILEARPLSGRVIFVLLIRLKLTGVSRVGKKFALTALFLLFFHGTLDSDVRAKIGKGQQSIISKTQGVLLAKIYVAVL
jgi:hypothetical protein